MNKLHRLFFLFVLLLMTACSQNVKRETLMQTVDTAYPKAAIMMQGLTQRCWNRAPLGLIDGVKVKFTKISDRSSRVDLFLISFDPKKFVTSTMKSIDADKKSTELILPEQQKKPFATVSLVKNVGDKTTVVMHDTGERRPGDLQLTEDVSRWLRGEKHCSGEWAKVEKVQLDNVADIDEMRTKLLLVVRVAQKSGCGVNGAIEVDELNKPINEYRIPCVFGRLKLLCEFNQTTKVNEWGIPHNINPKTKSSQPACQAN
ncbi:MAG: hypothetical protein OEZ58_22970 [Gammaproteobacteria bacterium]|nr:hypothetical protein [Gammaproteobacteria bacterium]MDH5731856.1 hypothetical protein [Gammaproteobacteria bacterium]